MSSFNLLFAIFLLTEHTVFNVFTNGKGNFGVEAIFGGLPVTRIEDFNHMAGIRNKHGDVICGATILSRSKLVSAAHCVHRKSSLSLVLGTLNTSHPHHIVDLTDEEIIIHPEYADSSCIPSNDLVVFDLKEQLNFDNKIGGIKMVDENYVANLNDEVCSLGYSQRLSDETESDGQPLQFISSTISDFDECQNAHVEFVKDICKKHNVPDSFEVPKLDKTQVCVSTYCGYCIVDKGDSGGPLITMRDGDFKLLGVTSLGVEGLPAVFTLVTPHQRFIRNPKKFVADYRRRHRSGSTSYMATH